MVLLDPGGWPRDSCLSVGSDPRFGAPGVDPGARADATTEVADIPHLRDLGGSLRFASCVDRDVLVARTNLTFWRFTFAQRLDCVSSRDVCQFLGSLTNKKTDASVIAQAADIRSVESLPDLASVCIAHAPTNRGTSLRAA